MSIHTKISLLMTAIVLMSACEEFDAEPGSGQTCRTAIKVSSPFLTLSTDLSGFRDSSNLCGEIPGPDIWFEVEVPAHGVFFATERDANTLTALYGNDACGGELCWFQNMGEMEQLTYLNVDESPDTFFVSVDADDATAMSAPVEIVAIVSAPQPDTMSCESAVDIPEFDDVYYWTTFTSHLGPPLEGDESCLTSSEVQTGWLRVSVPAGQTVSVNELTSAAFQLSIVTGGCESRSCDARGVDSVEWRNDSESTEQILVAVSGGEDWLSEPMALEFQISP